MKILTTYFEKKDEDTCYNLGEDVDDISDTIFDGIEPEKLTGAIFRFCQREYGKCTSKVYINQHSRTIHVGWVFEKRIKYQDCNKTYLQEVWVSLLDKDETRREIEYHAI